ncbi:hypothetical protein EAG08_05410 [Chryseobacterium sp. 3008163]|nr:hypothetical protein EAG08_05410 [Chryseobacterium sp. 3008163]
MMNSYKKSEVFWLHFLYFLYFKNSLWMFSGLPFEGRNNKISTQSFFTSKYTLTCFFPNNANLN